MIVLADAGGEGNDLLQRSFHLGVDVRPGSGIIALRQRQGSDGKEGYYRSRQHGS